MFLQAILAFLGAETLADGRSSFML